MQVESYQTARTDDQDSYVHLVRLLSEHGFKPLEPPDLYDGGAVSEEQRRSDVARWFRCRFCGVGTLRVTRTAGNGWTAKCRGGRCAQSPNRRLGFMLNPPHLAPRPSYSLDEYLARTELEDDYDWAIPGLLEYMDRLVLTGGEGAGKSTFLRQFGAQVAAGLTPFSLEPMQPLRVLLIDLENSERLIKRDLRCLRELAGGDGVIAPYCRPEGIDLTEREDRSWLRRAVMDVHPDLVLLGPLYKATPDDLADTKTSRTVASALDELRVEEGFALIMEAHTPQDSRGHAVTRPYGARLWMQWPEFGLHLSGRGELTRWRADRDAGRQWPLMLRRGEEGEWPWMPLVDRQQMQWAQVLDAVRRVGANATEREIADASGVPKTTVHRLLEARGRPSDG